MLVADMHSTLDRLYGGYASQLSTVDAARMQLRTDADARRWSAQQIVEHLLLTFSATNDNFQQRLEKGARTKAVATMQARVGQFVVCTLGMFPKGRQAPEMVIPRENAAASGDEMLARMAAELGRFDELARKAERVFGGQRAVQHPVLGPMSVKNWRLFHLRHGEHHLRQVAGILGGE